MRDPEVWETIQEFPIYSVSNYGRIHNDRAGHIMATSCSNHGHVKISLLDHRTGVRYTRSVAFLVGSAFVYVPDHRADSVVLLDGDLSNVAAWNLAWRPRWFAWKYRRQLVTPQPRHFHNLRIRNIDRGVDYQSIVEAGMIEGLLFEDIWRSCCYPDTNPPQARPRIYPFGHEFKVTERV